MSWKWNRSAVLGNANHGMIVLFVQTNQNTVETFRIYLQPMGRVGDRMSGVTSYRRWPVVIQAQEVDWLTNDVEISVKIHRSEGCHIDRRGQTRQRVPALEYRVKIQRVFANVGIASEFCHLGRVV